MADKRIGLVGAPWRGRVVKVLKKIPVFAGLFEEEYLALLDHCHVVQVPPDETLFEEGETGYDMYVVLSGSVDIITRKGGTLHTMEPGDILGEIAMIYNARRSAAAVAREKVALLRIGRDDLESLLGRRPRISYLVMKSIGQALAERLVEANERLAARLVITLDEGYEPQSSEEWKRDSS